MSRLIDLSDAWIDREPFGKIDTAQLRDIDGAIYFDFPKSWTDDQIMHALRFANKAYDIGNRAGRREKAAEIRRVIDEQ